jgi:hypothetical protein
MFFVCFFVCCLKNHHAVVNPGCIDSLLLRFWNNQDGLWRSLAIAPTPTDPPPNKQPIWNARYVDWPLSFPTCVAAESRSWDILLVRLIAFFFPRGRQNCGLFLLALVSTYTLFSSHFFGITLSIFNQVLTLHS